MNIVIAGAGAVGTHLAKMLSRQEHNIMLIDTNQDKLEDLESQIDILSIVGSCTSIGALKDAEVGKCDLYIAVNPQEDQNINSAILTNFSKHTNGIEANLPQITANHIHSLHFYTKRENANHNKRANKYSSLYNLL